MISTRTRSLALPLLFFFTNLLASITWADGDALRPFDELMTSFLQEHHGVGASLAVARNGKIVYAKGFGDADVGQATPVTVESRFRIASISKPITSAAIMLLVRDGKLKLEDHVVDVLDLNCTDDRWNKITIRNLLQHSGGWDRDKSYDAMFRAVPIAKFFKTTPPATAEQVIQYMTREPLDFDPGEKYAYSNFGYCLLGRVIERLTNQSYEAYVQQHVLKPLGITEMQIGRTLLKHRAKNEVRYYDELKSIRPSVFPPVGSDVPAPYGAWHLEAMDSHGAWIATATDVCRFGARLTTLLRPEEIEATFARPPAPLWTDPDAQEFYYGFGWLVRPQMIGAGPLAGKPNLRNTWHTGSLPGTGTLLVRRYDGLTWAVLFNTRNAPNRQRLTSIIDPLLHVAADQVKDWPTQDIFDSEDPQ